MEEKESTGKLHMRAKGDQGCGTMRQVCSERSDAALCGKGETIAKTFAIDLIIFSLFVNQRSSLCIWLYVVCMCTWGVCADC